MTFMQNSIAIVHPHHPALVPEGKMLKHHGQVLKIGMFVTFHFLDNSS